MKTPNFFVVGAAKSGTTALYHYLKQHPEIFMSPIKEPNFFAFEGHNLNFQGPGDKNTISTFSITELEDYLKLFSEVAGERAIGEASPAYLYYPHTAKRIKRFCPEARIIAILRNPVDRAYSAFKMLRGAGREPLVDFETALSQEGMRIENNCEHVWHYINAGFYAKQLKRYYEVFGRQQIHVYLYEDFQQSPQLVLKDIFCFLNVNSNFTSDTTIRHHISQFPTNRLFHEMIVKPNPIKYIVRPFLSKRVRTQLFRTMQKYLRSRHPTVMSPETHAKLSRVFHDDILELQQLINRDLSSWLEVGQDEG